MARFAIYFAPEPSSALWQVGSSVIGYDAVSGADVAFATAAGSTAQAWSMLTAEPRRYGFHATLKAPFELAAGVRVDDVLTATDSLAITLNAARIARLEVAEIGRFIALVPLTLSADLRAISDACVMQLDHLRAPLSEQDRARRLASPLTERQIALLDSYGYPYVLEQFRFHMTLTGPIGDARLRAKVRAALATLYDVRVPLGPLAVDRIVVFHQPTRDARFHVLAAFPLNRSLAS